MAGASKGSKNNPSNKGASQKVKLALSSECEVCTTQCAKGIQYIASLKAGKAGKGVVCKKINNKATINNDCSFFYAFFNKTSFQ